MSLQRVFLTLGGLGRLKNPAICTSAAALAFGTLMLYTAGAESLFTLAFALFLVGIFEINKFENRGGSPEDPSVVIDVAVGIWVALTVGVQGLPLAPNLPYALPTVLFLTFVSYLYFDRRKPSTIGWIGRNLRGGLGAMLDDVLAGFAAGMLTLLILKGIGMLRSAG